MTDLREAAQMALDALEWNLHTDLDNIPACTKWLNIANKTAEALRVALTAPPEELDLPKVRLEEFLKLIEGKEDFRGIPLMRTEWPTIESKLKEKNT